MRHHRVPLLSSQLKNLAEVPKRLQAHTFFSASTTRVRSGMTVIHIHTHSMALQEAVFIMAVFHTVKSFCMRVCVSHSVQFRYLKERKNLRKEMCEVQCKGGERWPGGMTVSCNTRLNT